MGRYSIVALAILAATTTLERAPRAQPGRVPNGAPPIALGLVSAPAHAAEQPARLNPDGSLQLVGHRVACEKVRTRLDKRLDNVGAAAPSERLLVINPLLLGRERPTVQLFVFHHECGHHRVGINEIQADCWAVARGVESGWLDRKGLDEVCRSFGDAPETRTHPSGKRRCAALDQCFAAVNAAKARDVAKAPQSPPATVVAAVNPIKASPATPTVSSIAMRASAISAGAPRLVSGPHLIREGTHLR